MKSKYIEYGGKLALVCCACMVGVAGAYVAAKPTIEEGKAAAFRSAIREVLGLAADAADPEPLNPDAPPSGQVFKATVDGEERYATQGAQQGFSSVVVVAVGARMVDGEPRIIEVRVISQNETPGLGTRIAELETNLTLWSTIGQTLGSDVQEVTDWFFLKQNRDKGVENMLLTGDAAEADQKIVRITGVTITTNASTIACKKALIRIKELAR